MHRPSRPTDPPAASATRSERAAANGPDTGTASVLASVHVSSGRDRPVGIRLHLSRVAGDATETVRIWAAAVDPGEEAEIGAFVRSAGHHRLTVETDEDAASHGWLVDGSDDGVVVRLGRDGRVRIRERRA